MQDRRHKEGREFAHGQTYDDWTIRRQPSSEMKRSGIELSMARKVKIEIELGMAERRAYESSGS